MIQIQVHVTNISKLQVLSPILSCTPAGAWKSHWGDKQ